MAVDIAEAVSETVDKIKSNGDKAKAYIVDIASEQQIDNFASEIREQIGHVDVLFNNAGVRIMRLVEFMSIQQMYMTRL